MKSFSLKVLPRAGGFIEEVECLKAWRAAPMSMPGTFIRMLRMATVAHALLVVWLVLEEIHIAGR